MNNEQEINSFSKYRLLKESIEKKLSNPIIGILVFLNRIIRKKYYRIKIPGKIQKSPADSRTYETDVKIDIKKQKINVTMGPFVADSVQEDFPFKNNFRFFEKINIELLKLESRLKWWPLLKSIFI